ncbi:hypothetical protein V8E51_014297 [Hyaloscypha variabilis]
MGSSFRPRSGDSLEEDYNPNLSEVPLHQDLHTPADARKLAQDFDSIVTEALAAVINANTSPYRCCPQMYESNYSGANNNSGVDNDSGTDSDSKLTRSDKLFKEGFIKRRASHIEGLLEFQAAIKAFMENMYEAKLVTTGNSFRLHHWLSDRATRALFGLYGKKGDATVEPSWRLFFEMLFNTTDNLRLAAAYPVRAQKAVVLAMERLWSPTSLSLEQALQAVRAELAPEPRSSDNSLTSYHFFDSDNFGRFLAGHPPREIAKGIEQPQQPDGTRSVPNAGTFLRGGPQLSVLQASQPLPSMGSNSAVATAAPPPLLPPPQAPVPAAPTPNGGPPSQPAQQGIRYSRPARPAYPRPLVPRDFYDPAQYAINPAGWDAAHIIIASASFRGVRGFSNMGVLGPIATYGEFTGDFRASVLTACANGYIRAHHNGVPRFSGAGKDHGRIMDWYIGLLRSPNGAFEEDRFRKYIMARLEQVLPAVYRTQVNAARQAPAPAAAGLNIPVNPALVNALPVNSALVNIAQVINLVPVNPVPSNSAPMPNNQAVTVGVNTTANMGDEDTSNSEGNLIGDDGKRSDQPDLDQDDEEIDVSGNGEAELPRKRFRRW